MGLAAAAVCCTLLIQATAMALAAPLRVRYVAPTAASRVALPRTLTGGLKQKHHSLKLLTLCGVRVCLFPLPPFSGPRHALCATSTSLDNLGGAW